MKNIVVAIIILFFVCEVKAGGADTAFYRRPYYLGIYTGYNGMLNGVFAGSPLPAVGYGNGYRASIYWSANYGLLFAFPFARKWEAELAFEGSHSQGWKMEVTDVHPSIDPQNVPGTVDYALHYTRINNINSRLQFAYEAFRKNNYAVLGGIEAWCSIGGKESERNYNSLGIALVAKSYIPVSHGNAAVQCSGLFGVAHSGMYVGLRVGFCLKGTRIYRHKPQHYYVRTYED